jgi:hypothetical protein
VEDVALLELSRGAGQDVRSRTGGVSIQERKNILKLIAKPNRAASLVEACPSQEAGGEGLVQEPPVQHQIESSVWRAHANRAQQSIPVMVELLEGAIDLPRFLPMAREFFSVRTVAPLAEDKHDFRRLLGSDVEMHLECCAWIGARLDASAEVPPPQSRGIARIALAAEKVLPVGRDAVGWMA